MLARPAVAATVTALTALSLVCAWLIWQPLSSAQSVSSAYTEIAEGRVPEAFTDARDAASADPVALQPKLLLAALYQSAHDLRQARAELADATTTQSENPASWLNLGSFDLQTEHDPRLALPELRRAQTLDPSDATTSALVTQAKAELAHK